MYVQTNNRKGHNKSARGGDVGGDVGSVVGGVVGSVGGVVGSVVGGLLLERFSETHPSPRFREGLNIEA
jgi:hypothetical protein